MIVCVSRVFSNPVTYSLYGTENVLSIYGITVRCLLVQGHLKAPSTGRAKGIRAE